MRTGIVTFHCSYNFGSALQAYALQKAIEGLGHECALIDYRSRDFDSYRIARLRRPRAMLGVLANMPGLLRRRRSFRAFWKKRLPLTERSYTYRSEGELGTLADQFDCFVCGSD